MTNICGRHGRAEIRDKKNISKHFIDMTNSVHLGLCFIDNKYFFLLTLLIQYIEMSYVIQVPNISQNLTNITNSVYLHVLENKNISKRLLALQYQHIYIW